MSIVSSIRDYAEFLNTVSNSLGTELTFSKFLNETFFYFLKTLQYSVYYIVSLQWLSDFTLLPVTIPQISHAIFSEHLFLEVENPSKIFFQFLEIPSLEENKFLLGFFNSFFLTLPLTVTHLIAFRRLIIQGIPAALFSFLGFILGQTLFIFCVTFGIRSILIPWLSLEPFNYILGLVLIFHIIYSMVGENLTLLKWENDQNKNIFAKFFLLNFILSWCEQSSIFQYFSNITLSGYPSILEGFSTKTTLASFFSHSNYIFGIFLGSLLFSILWIFIVWQIKNFIIRFTGISLAGFGQAVNKTTFVVVLGFTLSSIPFYGLDYLFTGPLGFISGDSVFKNTLFSQYRIPDPASLDPLEKYMNIDGSSFDRGRYLLAPDFYSFEDLNYRGESDWVMRKEKQSSITDSRGSFLSISKIFKKQKTNQSSVKNELNPSEENQYSTYNSLIPENFTEEKKLVADREKAQTENRFYNWYDFKELDNFDDYPSEKPFGEDNSFKQNFKNFNLSLSTGDFFQPQINQLEANIEKKIKQKYYSNPIYKNLLAVDIDLFLNRQPNYQFLSKQDELDLYQKREMLNAYYDSLRAYSMLPANEIFENFFDGTKSFANKIYNQQFKGTLLTVRRLFSLNMQSGLEWNDRYKFDANSIEENTIETVLKYDQPLYEIENKFSPYHEEIPEISFFVQDKKQPKEIKLKAFSGTWDNNLKDSVLVQMITKPLYAGWDENLRKFIITNKYLPQSQTGYEMTIAQDWSKKFRQPNQMFEKDTSSKNKLSSQYKKQSFLERQKIYFSSWPKTEADFSKSVVPFISLFDPKINDFLRNFEGAENSLGQSYTSLPSNYKLIQQTSSINQNQELKELPADFLLPKRGGFIWPGNFPFDFKSLMK